MAWVYLALLALFGWLMMSRRLTATIALPLAACAIGSAALFFGSQPALPGLDALRTFIAEVLEGGVLRLHPAIFAVLLGAILAAQLKLSGAAERIVRYAAEYSAEDRFRIALLLLLVIALLFTSLGGLGAVILVASVTLPLMFSLGFEPRVAGSILLFGLSLGGCLNPVNWATYITVLQLSPAQIIPFAVLMAALFFLVCCLYLLVQFREGVSALQAAGRIGVVLLIGAACALLILRLPAAWDLTKRGLDFALLAGLVLLAALLLLRLASQLAAAARGSIGWLPGSDNWLSALAPLVPLLLLLWSSLEANLKGAGTFQVPLLTALLSGIAFAALAAYTPQLGAVNQLMRALQEGLGASGPAVVLLIGIGMLLKATTLEPVKLALSPLVTLLPAQNPLGYVASFFVLSPLALYRGPLNLYGMGSGVVGIMAGSGVLAASLIMVALFAVGMLQGVCDPTNTHNVWIANFCRVSTGELLRHTLPWVMAIVLLGLIAGAWMFASGFAAVA